MDQSYKKNCEEFKKVMDDSFKKLESFLVEAEKAEKTKLPNYI